MAKTQETVAVTSADGRQLKKVSAKQIKLADQPVGFVLEGKYIGTNSAEHVDGDGELSTLHTMIIESPQTGERTKFLADAGLRGALSDAMIVSGDYFKAVKLEKLNIGKGRTMNQWDIYTLDT